MKVLVLTTSYPRGPGDPAGTFVEAAVDAARALDVEVEVVSPASIRHFGIAYGHGIVGNLRARPWLALLVPLFLWNLRRAAQRVEADLVHAHWLPAGLVALTLRRRYVVQLWGTDAALAEHARWLARPVLRRAATVIAASRSLADAARALGATRVRLVPSGITIPRTVRTPDDPPHVLYAGRLSAEKGIEDFLAATEGLPRVVVGAGPVSVPESVGAVPRPALAAFFDSAAVVVVPSRREGYGMVAREAMAHGRAVVATSVGGLVDAVDDGETGLLVPPGDPAALGEAVRRLLDDPLLRARFGTAARAKAQREWWWGSCAAALVAAYEDALR